MFTLAFLFNSEAQQRRLRRTATKYNYETTKVLEDKVPYNTNGFNKQAQGNAAGKRQSAQTTNRSQLTDHD